MTWQWWEDIRIVFPTMAARRCLISVNIQRCAFCSQMKLRTVPTLSIRWKLMILETTNSSSRTFMALWKRQWNSKGVSLPIHAISMFSKIQWVRWTFSVNCPKHGDGRLAIQWGASPVDLIQPITWRCFMGVKHNDVIKWKHFPRYWPFVRGTHRSLVNSPHKGQWHGQ